jgi:hypothetical protein
MKGMLRVPMTGMTGLRCFERGVIVVGDGAAIVVHCGAAGMMMIMMIVLGLVVVVVVVPRQLVTMHMEMVAARVRVEDEPRAWQGDTGDKEQNCRGCETAGPDAPLLHDAYPLPHPGSNGHVVHVVPYVCCRPMDWQGGGPLAGDVTPGTLVHKSKPCSRQRRSMNAIRRRITRGG